MERRIDNAWRRRRRAVEREIGTDGCEVDVDTDCGLWEMRWMKQCSNQCPARVANRTHWGRSTRMNSTDCTEERSSLTHTRLSCVRCRAGCARRPGALTGATCALPQCPAVGRVAAIRTTSGATGQWLSARSGAVAGWGVEGPCSLNRCPQGETQPNSPSLNACHENASSNPAGQALSRTSRPDW